MAAVMVVVVVVVMVVVVEDGRPDLCVFFSRQLCFVYILLSWVFAVPHHTRQLPSLMPPLIQVTEVQSS